MKHNSPKQNAGVWLDSQKAIIITINPENETGDYAIQETVKAPEHHGTGSEFTKNSAQHGDAKKYYKSISALLAAFDEILIFGPGKAQEEFQNHLKEDAHFNNKKITIDSAEQLTDPQMIARVRDFFN